MAICLFYLLILLIVSFAQEYPTPGTIAGVDTVETVDVTPTQIIITTTKVGPVEHLHVFIDVVDVENGIHIPPTNLSGLLLLITRGRYTINFLRPSTWYGVAFYSEQKANDEVHTSFEERLVRTLPSPEVPLQTEDKYLQKQPVEITTTRSSGNGKSVENLLITLKWLLPEDYRTNLQAVANMSLNCKDHVRFKTLKLADEESAKAVEVKLENMFEITEKRNISRHIIANILPKSCHRICWTTKLIAPFEHHNFEKQIGKDCKEIAPVTAEATLRDYLSYEISHGDLTIHTNVSGNDDGDDFVTIEAIQLPEGIETKHNQSNKIEKFSAPGTTNDFVVHGLDANKWYAVQYNYTKRSPFLYSESERFIIEPKNGATKGPLKIRFETKDANDSFSNSSSGNSTSQLKPYIVLFTDPAYKEFRIGVDVDPFCDAKGPNASHHFWLTSQNPQKELKDLDLIPAICGAKPEHSLCGNKMDDSSHVVPGVTNMTVCSSPNLCYTGNIEVNGKIYAMRKRCNPKLTRNENQMQCDIFVQQ
uniref:Uncharacterized protein n=1 Tax=Panagrolaimus sp. JU765 TaxID=591449 RepID=A0AC34PZC4_9BILA